ELNAAFLFTIPGPKMIWQFGELGYDISRCYQTTNGEGGDCNTKTDPKPIRWDYKNEERRKRVFDTYSRLIHLRFHPWYTGAFQSGTVEQSLSGAFKWIKVTTANDTSDLVVIGNFGVNLLSGAVTFPTAGTWYNLFDSTAFSASGGEQSVTLNPGEYKVFVNRNLYNLTTTPVSNVPWNGTSFAAGTYPNPVRSGFTLDLALPQSGTVTATLYNSMGQAIKTLYNGLLLKGERQLPLQRPVVPNGTYFLKLQFRNETKTIALTLQ
ncbi:MAG: T9SS type A sorting domain-containing protein, partial [Bacteroidota bacterium]|nr:T9SS type A sorting domain-containing protein [Bacteroidota bacterium]